MTHSPLILADALSWLLGLRQIDPTDERVFVGWRYDLPAWAWLLVALAVGSLVWLGYRRMLGRKAGRVTLAVGRGLILLAIAALLAGPELVLPDVDVENDRVIFLLDRSASVTVSDVARGSDRISRDQQLASIIRDNADVWAKLAEQHDLDWYRFAESAEPITDPASPGDPTGSATALRTAIETALRRAAGKPISAVVLLTDGRSSESLGPDVWRVVRQAGAKLHAVPLGAKDPPLDLAIQRIDAPDRAFVKDTVVVRATVSRLGGGDDTASDLAPPNTKLKLIDTLTGEVLDEQPVAKLNEPIRLMTTPDAAGSVTWRIALESSEPELVVDNNAEQIDLALVDRPIRVLYVEGYPRWEYRYLKNLLIREDSIESSIMLISADRTFAQEGDVALRRLPTNEEEMRPFDVVIIGDVPSDFFSAGQLQLLEQHVAVHGAGLLWIGGPNHTPSSYATTGLAKLLPMLPEAFAAPPLAPPINVKPTPIADALGVLRLTDPREPSAEYWPPDLPPLAWAQNLNPLKPATEALAVDAESGSPLVVRMRYLASMTLYIATDEIWRWRYARGDLYPEQFYMQLIRMMARGRLDRGSPDAERVRLTVSQRRASAGETLVVEVRLLDPALEANAPETLEVEVVPENGQAGPDERRRITLTRDPSSPGRYTAPWTPRADGRVALRLATPGYVGLASDQPVAIARADAEMRYPAADHAALADLAERADGRVLAADQIHELLKPELVPLVRNEIDMTRSEPLWNSPLAFILLILLLTCEWVGRKLLGLA